MVGVEVGTNFELILCYANKFGLYSNCDGRPLKALRQGGDPSITLLTLWDMNFRRTRVDTEQSLGSYFIGQVEECPLREVSDLRDI